MSDKTLSKSAKRGWRGEDLRERNRALVTRLREQSTREKGPRIIKIQIRHERPHAFTTKESRLLKKGTSLITDSYKS